MNLYLRFFKLIFKLWVLVFLFSSCKKDEYNPSYSYHKTRKLITNKWELYSLNSTRIITSYKNDSIHYKDTLYKIFNGDSIIIKELIYYGSYNNEKTNYSYDLELLENGYAVIKEIYGTKFTKDSVEWFVNDSYSDNSLFSIYNFSSTVFFDQSFYTINKLTKDEFIIESSISFKKIYSDSSGYGGIFNEIWHFKAKE